MSPAETNTETLVSDSHEGHDHSHDHGHSHAPAMTEECKREVFIEIPTNVVAKETEKIIRKYQKMARIPGFRVGKVPASIVRNRFKDEVRSELLESLLPEYFRAEVQKKGFVPISQPYVSDLYFEEGEPLRFKAAFEIMPEIDVQGYKALKADKKEISISEDEVDEALRQLQERQAAFDSVEDRPLQDGDFAQVSFEGLARGSKNILEKKAELQVQPESEAQPSEAPVEQPVAKPIQVQNVLVEIGGKTTVKDFSDNLCGLAPADEKTFDVNYPDDFSDQRLAGQVVTYTVKVQGIKQKKLPELNDEFAKELGQFSSLAELRQRLRENMESERRHEVEHSAKEKLVDQLVAANEFPVPQALIDRQIETRLERGFRALAAQGMRMEDIKRMSFERLREGQKSAAVREVKASLLLDKIAELENIDATEEDVNREIEIAAAQSQQSVAAIRERLQKEGSLDRIRDRIRNEKALDFLYRESA